MWSILKIYMGFGLLAIYVHGIKYDQKYFERAWKKNELIDGIFMRLSCDPLPATLFNTIYPQAYAGANLFDKNFVTMKTSAMWTSSKQYQMYSYLRAIKNDEYDDDVEKYGISPIYYYSINEELTIHFTVFTFFECNLSEKKIAQKVNFKTQDYLILFRYFVRQSKYVHSCGFVHCNVNPMNIMLREGRSFLINFTRSSKINYKCSPFADWKQFLLTMAMLVEPKMNGLLKFNEELHKEKRTSYDNFNVETVQLGVSHEEYIKGTVLNVECADLKAIMNAFYEEAFNSKDQFPNYDHFDEIITRKIGDNEGVPAIFSWLKGSASAKASKDLRQKRTATAKEIDNPKFISDRTYKDPYYTYFEENKEKMAAKAEKNRETLEEWIYSDDESNEHGSLYSQASSILGSYLEREKQD